MVSGRHAKESRTRANGYLGKSGWDTGWDSAAKHELKQRSKALLQLVLGYRLELFGATLAREDIQREWHTHKHVPLMLTTFPLCARLAPKS